MPLRTIAQLRADEQLSRYQVEWMLRNGLEHVKIGTRKMVPEGAFERFIEERKEATCPGETTALASGSSTSEAAITSCGQKAVAAASAARVRQIGSRLKSTSRSSSMTGRSEPGHVIPLKS